VSSGRELLARFITLVQAVTKSWTNCACASELPQTSARARNREFEPKTRSMRRLDLSAVSSARYKQGIDSMEHEVATSWSCGRWRLAYQQDSPGVVRYGLVAEEVQAVYPSLAW